MFRLGFGLVLLLLSLAGGPGRTWAETVSTSSSPAASSVPTGSVVVAEGKDFATQVLRDPWDMNALSDVSIYLNRSGQSYDTRNISVANGVFSAVSNSGDTNFSPLFPGYEDMIKSANMGALYPINSATYRCLYVAMRIDEQQSDSQAQLLWFKDSSLNSGQWAQSGGYWTTDNQWLLYAWQLDTIGGGPNPWNTSSTWQGLRIDPTQYANTPYDVDWVRLTDCAAVNTTVTFPANGSINAVWLRPSGTSRDILVKSTGVNGGSGSTQLDVQGIQPGTYTVRLGTSTACCITNANVDTLIVNQAPIAHFVTPSFISGAEYALNAGNAWDFASANDVEAHYNNTTFITGSLLDIVTQAGPLPAGTDSQVFINTPADFTASQYRYLNVRMFTQWDWPSPNYPWPNMPDGMVMRWIWSIQGTSGLPTHRCYLVSQDIPFDIGWRTYTIDLFDSYNGSPEEKAGECPGTAPNWANSGLIKELRLDPNENVTGRDPISQGAAFHQQIDWIKLTAMDRVNDGTPYRVQIDLNRPAGDVNAIEYFYTTSLANPTQQRAQPWSPPAPTGPFRSYLPLAALTTGAAGGADTLPQADLSFWWNTTNVPPATYYLCARITITPNTATYCSLAPVQVY